jgi:tetratricopeptide (TPR) repeat protein
MKPKPVFLAAACLLLGSVVSYSVRGGLARDFAKARTKRDIYALPSPRQAVVFSLGYRSAMAELIFAHVLVESGLHLQERRRFDTLDSYLNTVIALDPKFATPYRLADTLLTFQAGKASLKDFKQARAILERGMQELPYDQELHLTAGQFLAYLAAPRVEEFAGRGEGEQWKLAGARALARSCELIGRNENIPYHCITAAHLFDNAGERQAMQRFLERVLAVSDDESIRELAFGYLGRSLGKAESEAAQHRFNELDLIRKAEMPFIGKNRYLLLPPHYDPFVCVGYLGDTNVKCATSLLDWHARNEQTSM